MVIKNNLTLLKIQFAVCLCSLPVAMRVVLSISVSPVLNKTFNIDIDEGETSKTFIYFLNRHCRFISQ